MSAALEGAVELLERSLSYTWGTLADVRPDHLDRPTPCDRWDLRTLLAHMEDALDAFTEAAAGHVVIDPVPVVSSPVWALREKACALLGAWTSARPAAVVVGDTELESPVLVAAAALEITVHGWDVGQATGGRGRIPPDLARGLLPIAGHVVHPADRAVRFAAPAPAPAGASYDVQLLAYTGRTPDRMTGPPTPNRGEAAARRGLAS